MFILFIYLFSFFFFFFRDNVSSSFLSTYCCPQPNTIADKAFLCTITGFIIPEKIIQLLEQLW